MNCSIITNTKFRTHIYHCNLILETFDISNTSNVGSKSLKYQRFIGNRKSICDDCASPLEIVAEFFND